MKNSKRTRTLAVLTAAAMLTSFVTTVPAMGAEAEGKNVSVTLDDWSETLTYTDIPQAEYQTTEITIKPDWKGTVSFSDVDPDQDPQLRQLYNDETQSGNYSFDIWNNRGDLVSAIEAKEQVKLTDDSSIIMTGMSVAYSWELTTTDDDVKDISAWPNVWGYEGDRSKNYTANKGSDVFKTADYAEIESFDGFDLGLGAWSNNPDDTLNVTVEKLTITVQYSVTANGGWKSLDTDGKAWDFNHYRDGQGNPSDMFVKVLDAIQEQTGSRPEVWDVQVNDISMDFEWTFNTAAEDREVCMFPSASGLNGETWDDLEDANVPENNETFKFKGKSGSGSTSASTIARLAGVEITDYTGMFMNIGAWTDNPEDTLTLSLKNIKFDVTYVTENNNNNNSKDLSVTLDDWSETLTYTDIPQAEYQTTEITIEPNWKGTVSFSDVDPDQDPQLRQLYDEETESGNYCFNIWDNRGDLVSAIEAKEQVTLTEDSSIIMTGMSVAYSWELTTTDDDVKDISAWPSVWGYEVDYSKNYTDKKGSDVFKTADYAEIESFDGFNLGLGAWSNNPDDTLNVTVEKLTITVQYSVIANGGWKALDMDGKAWQFDHYSDDKGSPAPVMEKVLAAIKEQTGESVEAGQVQVNDISMDYEWTFNTAVEDREVGMFPSTCGLNGETWYDANVPENDETFKFKGKSGSGSTSASTIARLAGVEIKDYHGMFMNIGAWTDNPEDTLTLSLKNIKFDVTINYDSGDYPRLQISYDEVKDAKYLKIDVEVSTKDSCGHDIDHIGDDGVKYFDEWTYCPWAGVEIIRISADGTASDPFYAYLDLMDSKYSYSFVTLSDIYAEIGELTEGEMLEFCGYDSANVTNISTFSGLPLMYDPESIDELVIEESCDWDEEKQENVPNGKPEIAATLQLGNYAQPKSLNGYAAIAVDYTLLNPNACSALTVILHGWEADSVGWDARYYAVEGKSGRIIIDLSDLQDKTFHNVFVGVVAQPTAQIGDPFVPCFTVTNAELLTSCSETATAEIDPIEPIDPPETDEFGRKTVNITLESDWERTVDFSGVSEGNGDYRHFYNEETDSGDWHFDKVDENETILPQIIEAVRQKTGEAPSYEPFIINNISVNFDWEFNTKEEYTEVNVNSFVAGLSDNYDWIEANIPDEPNVKLYDKKGSYTLSSSRVAALDGKVDDISDYLVHNLNIGAYSEDPDATLTLRVTSVDLNVTYLPKQAMYLTYDELKNAQAVKVYYNKSDRNDCGHGYDHIGDDGIDYSQGMTYCPWSDIEIRRISADGTISKVYRSGADEYNDIQSVTVTRKLSHITEVVGELSDGDKLEIAGNLSSKVTKVEALDTMPDIAFAPISIGETTIEEACDWFPTGLVPNGDVEIRYYGEALISGNPIYANDYSAIKFNYTLENPDDCSAIIVVIQGWNDSYVEGESTEWVEKYYPATDKSGTIVIDLSEFGNKYFFNILVGVAANPDVNIGDKINPGFKMTEGALMVTCTDPGSQEIPRVLSVVDSIKRVNETVQKMKETNETYILSDDELDAIEAVLKYDYSK